MLFRKKTKRWTTKDGRKIRICDMTDSHLLNTVAMLERYQKAAESYAISSGHQALSTLRGEMAVDLVERELDYIEAYGLEPCEVHPLFADLLIEKERRNL